MTQPPAAPPSFPAETPDSGLFTNLDSTADADFSGELAPLAAGVAVIEAVVRTLPGLPGVYRMLDAQDGVLYVGKAKNLRKRVVAYTRPQALPVRLQRMIARTVRMEIVTTHTETEALLLEANLIKRLAPRYNILLKDDKSFPYILLTGHQWPRIVRHRGARGGAGQYFGPFASAEAVSQTLGQLQRAFLLRSCTDQVLSTRSRPCLLYQIKRCSAPCAERIAPQAYQDLVAQAVDFLTGRSQTVRQDLVTQMEAASQAMDYETAALYRDRIRALARIQEHQDVNFSEADDADVIALHQAGGQACVQVFVFRGGCNFGNRAFFPSQTQDESPGAVLAAFLAQFYGETPPPREILLSQALDPEEEIWLTEALSEQAGHKITLSVPRRGPKRKMIEQAYDNAREALGRRLAERDAQSKLLAGVAALFDLPAPPQRIEVYDNSHIQGSHAVGGMIVAGPEGFERAAYRTYTIRSQDSTPGDDFAMMREVFQRRFRRVAADTAPELPAVPDDPLPEQDQDAALPDECGLDTAYEGYIEPESQQSMAPVKGSSDSLSAQRPDLVLIDGGAGQLLQAVEVLRDLGLADLPLVAIAKGADRDAGRERFFLPGRIDPLTLPPNDPVLYYLQRLRDEAHRFAIGTHRARRSRALKASPLDDIAGVGPRRKKALLLHFGSAKGVAAAGLTDLMTVPGINAALAKTIYDHFHERD